MVSHEEWHRKYFDRVIVMQDGKIVSDGDITGKAGLSSG
jgi:energy-coupling factor transporter ATP-binding protein EcfA2